MYKETTLSALLLIFSSVLHATAILNTDIGRVSADYGSVYPTLPTSPIYIDSIDSEVFTSGFGSKSYYSTPNPNYGWVEWSRSEQYLSFSAGQEICFSCDFDYQGYGFSHLDFSWRFSVEGDGGKLQQDLLSGSGAVNSTLLDITEPSMVVSLSANGMNGHDGGYVDLLDGHTYFLCAILVNRANADGWEAEYFLNLENSKIELPEPASLLLLSAGLAGLGFAGRRKKQA